jgi:hypothetical protein
MILAAAKKALNCTVPPIKSLITGLKLKLAHSAKSVAFPQGLA